MDSSKPEESTKIGELLIQAGYIKKEQLSECLMLAQKTLTPVGRVFRMTGNLTEEQINSALKAQSIIRSEQINYSLAIRLLKLARTKAITFEKTLQEYNDVSTVDPMSRELAELLLTAEVIQQEQLDSAIVHSKGAELPLGRTLVSMGLVPPSVMAAVLTAMVLLKENEIQMEEAVQGIKIATAKQVSLEHALILEGIYSPPSKSWVRLGELLALAGLLSENDGVTAIESGLRSSKKFGEVLVESGFISENNRDAALQLQKMVSDHIVNAQQASELLKGVNACGITVEQAYARYKSYGDNIVQILKKAGLVTEQAIESAKTVSSEPIVDLSICLYETCLIDKHTLECAQKCFHLVINKYLDFEHATIVLNYCVRSRIGVLEALQELAWDKASESSTKIDLVPSS